MSERIDGSFGYDEDWVITGTCRDSDETILNLTGATVRLRIKTGDTTVFDLATPADGQLISPTLGTYQFVIPKATIQSANLAFLTYDYGVQVTLADSRVTNQNHGKIRYDNTVWKS